MKKVLYILMPVLAVAFYVNLNSIPTAQVRNLNKPNLTQAIHEVGTAAGLVAMATMRLTGAIEASKEVLPEVLVEKAADVREAITKFDDTLDAYKTTPRGTKEFEKLLDRTGDGADELAMTTVALIGAIEGAKSAKYPVPTKIDEFTKALKKDIAKFEKAIKDFEKEEQRYLWNYNREL